MAWVEKRTYLSYNYCTICYHLVICKGSRLHVRLSVRNKVSHKQVYVFRDLFWRSICRRPPPPSPDVYAAAPPGGVYAAAPPGGVYAAPPPPHEAQILP